MVWTLSPQQADFEERTRTVSLAVTALGVVCSAGVVFVQVACSVRLRPPTEAVRVWTVAA